MKQTKEIKLAYAAGFLDGEGCIRIQKRNPRNGRSLVYNLGVAIYQKDGQVMDWLYGNFGGMVYLKDKKDNWIYEWRLTDKSAYNFLKLILPFLKYKKKQAELGIQFYQRRIFERKKDTSVSGRFISLTQNELDEREKLYQKMCSMKKEFVKSKNPNVVVYNLKSMVQE